MWRCNTQYCTVHQNFNTYWKNNFILHFLKRKLWHSHECQLFIERNEICSKDVFLPLTCYHSNDPLTKWTTHPRDIMTILLTYLQSFKLNFISQAPSLTIKEFNISNVFKPNTRVLNCFGNVISYWTKEVTRDLWLVPPSTGSSGYTE